MLNLKSKDVMGSTLDQVTIKWLLHCVPKNVLLCDCLYVGQIFTDFQNSFTSTFCGQLAIK